MRLCDPFQGSKYGWTADPKRQLGGGQGLKTRRIITLFFQKGSNSYTPNVY
jgi:hypothetical protein